MWYGFKHIHQVQQTALRACKGYSQHSTAKIPSFSRMSAAPARGWECVCVSWGEMVSLRKRGKT
jgi:hypothetical protein